MKAKRLLQIGTAAFLQLIVLPSYPQTIDIKNSSQEFVYMNTDCQCYEAGESIFFKAYVSNERSAGITAVSEILSVTLVDQEGLGVASGKYPVMRNTATGTLQLSSLLSEGYYILMAYTNEMKNSSPEILFSKIIEVKNPRRSGISAILTLKDTVYDAGSLLNAYIRFSDKNDNPVASSNGYRLVNKKTEVNSGKGKTGADGRSTLAIPLPQFQSDDTLELMVSTSYKGRNITYGIVIPTPGNYQKSKEIYTDRSFISNNKRLNIKILTDKLQHIPGDKVRAEINVTDNTGKPVIANLSISVSEIIHNPVLSWDNEMTACLKSKSDQSGKSCARCLSQIIRTPGNAFIVQEKNDIKRINKSLVVKKETSQSGYDQHRSIIEIINQIKPYHLEGGKIMFAISGTNSINYQDGALIVIDGIKMGTDAGILSTIPVTDIAKINISTNPSDVQRYTALNNAGVIELIMKKGPDIVEKKAIVPETGSKALLWIPDLVTDKSGKASVTFVSNKTMEVIISVSGITESGLAGSSKFEL